MWIWILLLAVVVLAYVVVQRGTAKPTKEKKIYFKFKETPPSLLSSVPAILCGAFVKKEGKFSKGFSTIPHFEVDFSSFKIDMDKYKKYKLLCGVDENQKVLSPCYPAVMSFNAIPFIVSSVHWPLSPFGLIHIGSTIKVIKDIPEDSILDFRTTIKGHNETEKGFETIVTTETFLSTGECVWVINETLLSRKKTKGGQKTTPKPSEEPEPLKTVPFKLPANLGLSYAKVAGDWNPHHLYPITAKLFGFKAPIIHGMWSLERSLSELKKLQEFPPAPYQITVSFKLPIFLPGSALLKISKEDDSLQFKLTSQDGKLPHLVGSVKKV